MYNNIDKVIKVIEEFKIQELIHFFILDDCIRFNWDINVYEVKYITITLFENNSMIEISYNGVENKYSHGRFNLDNEYFEHNLRSFLKYRVYKQAPIVK